MPRTYLFVRTWIGFDHSFDAHRFDDVDNDRLCDAMSEMAGTWASTNLDRVRLNPPMTAEEISEAAGWTARPEKPDRRHATAPMWEVFHVEDDEDSARDVLGSLRSYEHHFRLGPITLRSFPADKFQRAELIDFERQLEWLGDEEIERAWAGVQAGASWEHPRHLLREEALARGQALRRLLAATANQKKRESASAQNSTKTPNAGSSGPVDLELRADLARLNETQREILRALLAAVRNGKGLTLESLVEATKANNKSSVERGIKAMEKMGLEIPNLANGAGYSLRGRSLQLAQELARIDADRTPKRR